jgi:hypothetical protein
MFNPTQVVIEAFVRELQAMYVHTYSVLEPSYPDVIAFIGRSPLWKTSPTVMRPITMPSTR